MKESEVKLLLSGQLILSVSPLFLLLDTPSLYVLSADRVGVVKLLKGTLAPHMAKT